MLSGPLMLDLQGLTLTTEEKELLAHPMVGGVILFARNYESITQVTELTQAIRQAVNKPLLIAVDQEGGRVQRFQTGFTKIPAMGQLGELYKHDKEQALTLSENCAWLLAAEVLAVGVDISFTPVLDLNLGISDVIGNRAFASNADDIIQLVSVFIKGLQQAGMAATGKHFPGHGSVALDSHVTMPVDERDIQTIQQLDLEPFKRLIAMNALAAIMPAHIVYEQVDKLPAGFSTIWLQQILRQELHFTGAIFSDDLTMQGAKALYADPCERVDVALAAGCDMVLLCNDRDAVINVLDNMQMALSTASQQRLQAMLALNTQYNVSELRNHPRYLATQEQLQQLGEGVTS